jgi:exonuclease SbcC
VKVLALDIEGFGPYREAQHVDFAAFDGDGLFVITGKTGAGKSTILDAICFALYGYVPRYDKAEKTLRSHFCGEDDPTSVTLEFEVGAQRYKVWRSPEYSRAKKRGTGTTTKQAEASLHIWRDGDWAALEVKPREVGVRIDQIMQLNADQFLQVILLAQGRFSEFLHSGTKERLHTLRSLFGTQRFEVLEQHLRDAAKELGRGVESADAGLASLVERGAELADAAGVENAQVPADDAREAWWDEVATALDEASVRAADARKAAAEASRLADEALVSARAVEQKRAQRARAQATVTELEERADEHAADVARLSAAERAKPVVAPLARVATADQAFKAAMGEAAEALAEVRESEAADTAWPADRGPLEDANLASLRARLSELAEERGSLAGALASEEALPGLVAAHDAAESAVAEARESREKTQEELDGLPDALTKLREELEASGAAATLVVELAAKQKAAGAVLAALDSVDALTAELAELRDAEGVASSARKSAVSAHDDLIQRRLHSEAARLAESLADDEACPVCGSESHPSPAMPSDDHVTDEDVAAAGEAAMAAQQAFDQAHSAVSAIEAKLETAREATNGADRESAEESQTTITKELAEATESAGAAESLKKSIADADKHSGELRESLDAQAKDIEEKSAAFVAAKSALEAARTATDKARGEFETVAARVDHVDQASEVLGALVTALATQAEAQKESGSAKASLELALAESGFDNVKLVTAASLTPDALLALSQQIQTHREALAAAKAVLAEASGDELPPEPFDLEALATTAAESAEVRDSAVATATKSESVATSFAALSKEYKDNSASTSEARERWMTARRLAETLQGNEPNDRRMRLESFVLAAKLEKIITTANARLVTMSSGQYRLEYDDNRQHRNAERGLGIRVFDAHTGRPRPTDSLSGGETFLASLALALSLAEVVTAEAGGIQLSTLFIDEGFGSLDSDTLEIAMATLDGLRSGGRTVGLISHVEAMKEAIPAKLEVSKQPDGSSTLKVRSGASA